MNKKIGIVILNFNTYNETVECIDSIYQNESKLENYSICIVDNGSKDNSGTLLFEKYKNDPLVTVISTGKNLGFSGGNNVGIREEIKNGADYVFLLNSDIVLKNDAISKMSAFFDEYDDVVCVGPRVYNLKGTDTQRAGKPLTVKGYIFYRQPLCFWFHEKSENLTCHKYDKNTDFIFSGSTHGCCFGLKRNFIINNKVLDDAVFLYCEENILAHQISSLGLKGGVCATAEVIHKESVSTGTISPDKLQFTRLYFWNSTIYILRKYAHANKFVCGLFSLADICIWLALGVKYKNYRESFSKFIEEKKRIMKVANN